MPELIDKVRELTNKAKIKKEEDNIKSIEVLYNKTIEVIKGQARLGKNSASIFSYRNYLNNAELTVIERLKKDGFKITESVINNSVLMQSCKQVMVEW